MKCFSSTISVFGLLSLVHVDKLLDVLLVLICALSKGLMKLLMSVFKLTTKTDFSD